MGTALLLVRYDTVAPAAVYGVLGGRLPTNLDPITVDFNFSKAGLGGTWTLVFCTKVETSYSGSCLKGGGGFTPLRLNLIRALPCRGDARCTQALPPSPSLLPFPSFPFPPSPCVIPLASFDAALLCCAYFHPHPTRRLSRSSG